MCSVPCDGVMLWIFQAEIALGKAYDELTEDGVLCVDTAIALNTLGIDPEICKEEAERHKNGK